MSAAPGQESGHHGITGTRPKAETKRVLSGRILQIAARAGVELTSWQVTNVMKVLRGCRTEHTDEQIAVELMKANWFPKPRRRQWRVGEGGGWATRS